MKFNSFLTSVALAILSIGATTDFNSLLAQTQPKSSGDDVWWGLPASPTILNPIPKTPNPIGDVVPRGGSLRFEWTMGSFDPNNPSKIKPHPMYAPFETSNIGGKPRKVMFHRPRLRDFGRPTEEDPTVTDWKQTIFLDGNFRGNNSVVYGGNIVRTNPWEFQPLRDLPSVSWRIPDITVLEQGAEAITVYTAVNLALYFLENPNGFLNGNWSMDQTLNELGINIVNGQIPGVQGLYFSTTDFIFDPNSDTGYVPMNGEAGWLNSEDFQRINGDLVIAAEHSSVPVPEPSSTLGFFALGTLGAVSTLKRKLKSSQSTEKETTKVG